jgi:hypothetical protein
MGEVSTLALVNEMGVMSLTTCSALIVFMRNKVAKRLRKEAHKETVGKSEATTKALYKTKKKEYKCKK